MLFRSLQIQNNLMDAAHASNVERFVFLGSSCIYPRECPQPIKEEYLLTGPLEKTNSAYAIAKIAGIELIRSYRKQYGRHWISLMPTNCYGPNDNFDVLRAHVLPALITKFVEAVDENKDSVSIWGTGKARREFIYSSDLAKATIFAMNKYDGDSHLNVGTGTDSTIRELAETLAKIVEFTGELVWDSSKPDGTPRKVLDVSKLKNLGWLPTVSLENGIQIGRAHV